MAKKILVVSGPSSPAQVAISKIPPIVTSSHEAWANSWVEHWMQLIPVYKEFFTGSELVADATIGDLPWDADGSEKVVNLICKHPKYPDLISLYEKEFGDLKLQYVLENG